MRIFSEIVISSNFSKVYLISRFKLWYTVDRPGEGWQYSSGFVNAEMIEKALFPPSGDNLVKIFKSTVLFKQTFNIDRFYFVVLHP